MRPLVVYLDTQDYIRLFNEPDDGPAHAILDQIISYRDKGDILIGYSWAIMLEFITRPTDKHREERVRRGELVKDICGPNAFPFFGDLQQGVRFPNNGQWITAGNGKLVSAASFRRAMEKQYFAMLAEQKGLNRAQRRNLSRPKAMRQLLRESTSTWGTKREDFEGFPVSDELIESGVILRFLKGRCSDAEFEEHMNRWLSDPTEFSRIAYDYADKPNLLDEFFGKGLDKMESALRLLQEHVQKVDEIGESRLNLRKALIDIGLDKRSAGRLTKADKRLMLDPSDFIARIEGKIGKGRADHIGHYFVKASRKGYSFKRSDFVDIMQMCYVPDCDLFRCDKAMANMFLDFQPFEGKLVGRFSELPGRIEALLSEHNI